MSDSDDTDILLLIPPDFFITSAEEKLRKYKEYRNKQKLEEISNCCCIQSQDYLNETIANALRDFNYGDWESINHSMDSLSESAAAAAAADALSMPPPTAAYKFLPTSQKAELNDINARLATFEHDRFAAPSDISTISHCTVRNHFGNNYKPQRDRMGITHSTPKCQPVLNEKVYGVRAETVDKGVLHEIDNFLEDRHYGAQWNPASNNGNYHSDEYPCCQEMEATPPQEKHASSLPTALNRLSLEHKFNNFEEKKHTLQAYPIDHGNLISLSDIWGKNGQANFAAATPNLTLKEEQLRRQHLERTVRTLHSRLLEYQQRLSVAIEVDRTKDAALASAHVENKSLTQELCQFRNSVSKLESDQLEYHKKQDAMQCELAQAVNLASKFQEKNDKMEIELNNCRRNTSESKKKIEELELKIHGAKTSEEFALNELSKLRDNLAKAEHSTEKLKVRCEDLEKEKSTLKHQKELLQEYHQKQKNRADSLETHRKSLQDALGNLTETESALKKKLETQQKTLKSHYQQQLENVVAQKLKEFQEQLDKMDENLRSEAREREHLIAERAVKQLELMNEKNELELNLLQEKHNEEVQLYRIQLANASKKIDELELKLDAFKSKRADIAEKLHDVMETQWQKALEILTSPNQSKTNCTTMDAGSPECNEHQGKNYDGNHTTKSSKNTNNFNIEETTPPQIDKLQAYIELLLSKSPSDFDKLDEILALSAKSKSAAGKLSKTNKRTNAGKPPWKA